VRIASPANPRRYRGVDVDVDRRTPVVRVVLLAELDQPDDPAGEIFDREPFDVVVQKVLVELGLEVVATPTTTHLGGRPDRDER